MTRSDVDIFSNPELQDRSLKYWVERLTREFGPEWKDLEIETWVADVDPEDVTEELTSKLRLLKVLSEDEERFYTDPVFMLGAIDIINGGIPDEGFEVLPSVTSLEAIYAVTLVRELFPSEDTNAIAEVLRYILNEEGFTFVPTQVASFLDDSFPETEYLKDAENKQKAVTQYIALMNRLN